MQYDRLLDTVVCSSVCLSVTTCILVTSYRKSVWTSE